VRRRPLVSVVVCTYARPEPLRAALASVCVQGVDGVEVVVVNDGGPDVAGVVAEFGDRLRVRLITLPTNEGLTAARRSGIGAARGHFVAFLDDDDLWLPEHLSVALDGLGSGVDMVYTTCLVADRVHHLGSGQPVSARYRFDYPFDAALLDVTNMIPVTSVVARRFDPAMLHRHDGVQDDWAMWLDLVRGAGWRAAHLPVATTVYHRVPQVASMTGQAASTLAGLRRFAAGHRRIHQRWPVPDGSRAGKARRLPFWMYRLVEQRHSAGHGVSHYYYERCLPLVAAAVTGRMTVDAAADAMDEAVAPDAVEEREQAAWRALA